MSKSNYPKSNLTRNLDDLLSSKPQSEIDAEREVNSKEEPASSGTKPEPEAKTPKTVKTSEKPVTQALPSSTESKTKDRKDYVMTYFSADNYNDFEEMYDDIKRFARQKFGNKLRQTHVAELAVMLTVEDYQKNKEKFFERISEKLKSE
ncbi:MAG TPA: hypothetical protein VK308_07885 [Pyrinomonadaceae bacterium]|nr:hypothetical protein [Pyrinomonadaceae bacterium]